MIDRHLRSLAVDVHGDVAVSDSDAVGILFNDGFRLERGELHACRSLGEESASLVDGGDFHHIVGIELDDGFSVGRIDGYFTFVLGAGLNLPHLSEGAEGAHYRQDECGDYGTQSNKLNHFE